METDDRLIFVLAHDEARRRACVAVNDDRHAGWTVVIQRKRRSLGQNALFHALCGDMERSRFEWGGKPRSLYEWKLILISGHNQVEPPDGEEPGGEVVCGIEGEIVSLREHTSEMNVKRMSSLIDYTLAFMAANEIDAANYRRMLARGLG